MSVIKQISTLPDTKRSFNDENDYAYINGLFVTKKEVLFNSEDELNDFDVWEGLLESGDLMPLHFVKTIEYKTEDTQYQESLQDFDYKLRDGRNKKTYNFLWSIERHELVDRLSGSDLYIIEYDRNGNLFLVEDSGTYRGVKTNSVTLEKMLFADEATPAFSPLFVDFREKFNFSYKPEFSLRDVDRQIMNVSIEYVDSDNINFSATYKNGNVDDISSSDITVTDNINGVLSYTLFKYLGGVYKLSGFNKVVTGGIIEIVSSLYLGCTNYNYRITIEVVNNRLYEDGDNMVMENGDNRIYEN